MCFGTCCASEVVGLIWRCRGVIDKAGADVEALFSDLHVGDVGMRVV